MKKNDECCLRENLKVTVSSFSFSELCDCVRKLFVPRNMALEGSFECCRRRPSFGIRCTT